MQHLRTGAGLMIIVGLWLTELYGWPAGANLIEQGLVIALLVG